MHNEFDEESALTRLPEHPNYAWTDEFLLKAVKEMVNRQGARHDKENSEPFEPMSDNANIILTQILKQQQKAVAPTHSESEFFELFAAEQILKERDLSYDELELGVTDDGGDGGIDSAYLFFNGELVQSEPLPSSTRKEPEIELILIQSKTSDGFTESAIEKLQASAEDLFDLQKTLVVLKSVYNAAVLEIFQRFRELYTNHAAKFPKLTISYDYATKGTKPDPKVSRKVERLKKVIAGMFSDAVVSFEFLGARRLLDLYRSQPGTSFELKLAENPIATGKQGFIGLIRLKDFQRFITDPNGKLLRNLFEANVRDYQGATEVNDEIHKALDEPTGEDFWWLNNGVTVLAKNATHSSKVLQIEEPQIVNGLQTSTEIHKFFARSSRTEKRHVLVRVIVPRNENSRDRIIKATNSQTAIPPASLRATEQIHRDIEDYLQPHGLFYDRRKNHYKNLGKPIDQIVSIPYMAQAVLAIFLQEPDNSRARPSSLLKEDVDHARIFDERYPLDLFLNVTGRFKRDHRGSK